MHSHNSSRLIQILKQTGAYLFLCTTFVLRFYNYAYDAFLAKSTNLHLELLKALGQLLLYALINHILIHKIVGLKTVLLFETILFVTLVVLTDCYATIENRFHGNYSAPFSVLTAHETKFKHNSIYYENADIITYTDSIKSAFSIHTIDV